MKTSLKKMLLLMAVVITAVVCFTFSASALFAEGQCGENLIWELNDQGELTISGKGEMEEHPWDIYKGIIKEVIIDEGVETICGEAFYNCFNLKSVSIATTVEKIESMAFCDCVSLSSIKLPDDLSFLGSMVFSGCSSLTNVNIPSKIELIELFTFASCKSLKEVTIPSSVKTIEYGAFQLCESLERLTIEDGIITIDEKAFIDCEKLESVVIPETVYTIGDNAFANCSALKKVEFKSESTLFPALGADVFWKSDNVFLVGKKDSSVYEYARSNNIKFCDLVNHSIVTLDAVKATCTTAGLTEGKQCDACGKIIVKQETIKATGHMFSEYGNEYDFAVYPKGAKIWMCEVCEETEKRPYTFKHSESLENVTSGIDYVQLREIGINDDVGHIDFYQYDKKTKRYFSVNNNVKMLFEKNLEESVGEDIFDRIYRITGLKSGTEYKFLAAYYGDEDWSDEVVGIKKFTIKTKKSHTYKTTTTKATLKKNGKVENKCTGCGEVKSTTIYYPKSIKLSATSYTYNGKVKSPSVTVKDSKGKKLKKDTDYTVSYEKGRKSPGKYTVKITFKGKYEGVKRLYFTITPKATSKVTASQTTTTVTLKWNKVTGADGYRVYKYDTKTKKYKKLKDVTKTTLKISKLKSGTAYKYKVRAYIKDDGTIWGSYSKILETSTKPATVTISKLTAGKKQMTAAWKTVSGATGYEVVYSTSKKFTKKTTKKVTIKKAKTKKTTIKKLSKGKKYYIKVRAFKTVGKKNIYGAYSSVKSIKVK